MNSGSWCSRSINHLDSIRSFRKYHFPWATFFPSILVPCSKQTQSSSFWRKTHTGFTSQHQLPFRSMQQSTFPKDQTHSLQTKNNWTPQGAKEKNKEARGSLFLDQNFTATRPLGIGCLGIFISVSSCLFTLVTLSSWVPTEVRGRQLSWWPCQDIEGNSGFKSISYTRSAMCGQVIKLIWASLFTSLKIMMRTSNSENFPV